MIKIELELPSGLRIFFEGDEAGFDRFTRFLSELPGFVESLALPAASSAPPTSEELETPASENGELSARSVADRLSAVNAGSDIERVTVFAQLAVEAGREGIDYETCDRLYTELGIPKPSRWARTFFAAKQRNLVRSVGRGLWKPTIQGENMARLGHRPALRRAGVKAGGEDS